MFSLRCNNRGISLVEVVIAIFLTTIGVLAVLSLQPSAWRTATRSDYMGRAAGILQKELETQQILIMNCCNAVAAPITTVNNVLVSGEAAAQPGDATFTVTTTITLIAANVWRIDVRVAWAGHTGIIESIVVTRQQRFQGACTC